MDMSKYVILKADTNDNKIVYSVFYFLDEFTLNIIIHKVL